MSDQLQNKLVLDRVKKSAIPVSNIATVITSVIKKIAGNDISTALNGTTATNSLITSLVYQRLNIKLSAKV